LNICLLASWIKRYNLDDQKLWRKLIDHKYDTSKANIFDSPTVGVSQFFRGMIWAAKMGCTWKIGNGRKVKLWEDNSGWVPQA